LFWSASCVSLDSCFLEINNFFISNFSIIEHFRLINVLLFSAFSVFFFFFNFINFFLLFLFKGGLALNSHLSFFIEFAFLSNFFFIIFFFFTFFFFFVEKKTIRN
jgi:hypothetical protein